MPPTPAEGQMAMMPVGTPNMAGTISLSTLIDLIIQRTYHELTVLAELLPMKKDMERKAEIYQFANRTRQLFIRLLALIKWTNSASKVDKCARISSFLHSQQMLFVETADMLARLARETLVHARLPSFSLPCAVDVLTLGTYPRLPLCIKEKILPPEPITAIEKVQTLKRLSQIIEHRVVMTDLQPYMRKPRIEDGRVKFCVENEFEVTLTLMGDGPQVPWRLLDIEILVEDGEMGEGQSLVHSLQVGYIHQIVQTRLLENDKPLHDLYHCLHTFCQSLQLEVLHSQVQSLIRLRLGDCVRVEEYLLGKSLTVSYWRDSSKKDVKPLPQQYKLTVHVDGIEMSKPLQISHNPQIQGSESTRVPHSIQSDHLSIEKILMQTVHVRSLAKLKDLERELRVILNAPCEIRENPSSVLCVSVLTPCLECEKLYIAVNILRGSFIVSLQQKGLQCSSTSLCTDLEQCLNGADRKDLRPLITELRCQVMLQRCYRTLQHIHISSCSERLPLIPGSSALDSLSKHKLYVKLPHLNDHYLVVEIAEVMKNKRRTCEYRYHLLTMKSCGSESNADTGLDGASDQMLLLKYAHIMRLDVALGTKGSCGKLLDVDYDEPEDSMTSQGKRKMQQVEGYESTYGLGSKRSKSSEYLVTDLIHLIGLCADRLPLIGLAEELEKNNLYHTGVKVDGDGVGMSLALLESPKIPIESRRVVRMLKSSLVSFTFRMPRRERASWSVELVFTNSPVRSTTLTEQSSEQRVCLSLEKISPTDSNSALMAAILEDWESIAKLYELIVDFSHSYNFDAELRKEIEVKSYSYKKITLAYGPNKCFVVTVTYNSQEKKFMLTFATVGQCSTSNCHSLLSTYLQKDLNKYRSLTLLSKVLYSTCNVVTCLGKLNTAPIVFIKIKPAMPQSSFTVLIQSSVHYRIMYRSSNCLDVYCKENGVVLIRDGAYSVFDSSSVVDGVSPIPGLQTFLSQFVDDSVSQSRRRSTTEDDNPPSPMDSLDALLSHPNPSADRRNMIAASPSSSSMLAQSPGNPGGSLPVPSPSSFNVPVPSPNLHLNSPAPPANAFMPHQAAQPGVQRTLPQHQWAASTPTALSHDAVNQLLNPTPHPPVMAGQTLVGGATIPCCALERFLGSVYLRRHILRIVQAGDGLASLPGDHGVVSFKAECGLQFHIGLNPTTMQSLRMKITQSQDYGAQWDAEDLITLEKFFYTKVACPPYRPNPMQAFMNLLKVQQRVLKDFIQIMKIELNPDRNHKWSLNWCLTIPYGWPGTTGPDQYTMGSQAVAVGRKILFMLQLLYDPAPQQQQQTVMMPVLYDTATNMTSMMDMKAPMFVNNLQINIGNMFKQFSERFNNTSTECSIYPAIRDIVTRLSAST